MNKLSFLFFILMMSSNIFSAELDVKIVPKNPVLNEPFKVEFTITSKEGDDPIINFKPSSNLEVISRGTSRVTSRTSYINGKMSYERKIELAYDLVASSSGFGFLRNITAEINGETIKHTNVRVHILKQARKPQAIFVRAETDKEEYYVGESIVVRYFIYNKSTVPLNSVEIKKFPKLDKFLKRYHVEKNIPNRVTYNGEVYMKRVHYTAQLYATKPGVHSVDPISLNVRYSAGRIDPFGGFGFGRLGNYKSKTIRSPKLELNILPLPAEGRPDNFTGLVGDHSFTLDSNKSKFLANEPIEYKLNVEGPGALELFEAPKLIVDSTVEEFESNADLEVKADFTARKVFDYTYLGRTNTTIEKYQIPLNYFDPNQKKYIEKNISIGPLTIVGLGNQKNNTAAQQGKSKNADKDQTKLDSYISKVEKETNEFKPIYRSINTFIYNSKTIFFVVAGLCLFMLVYLIFYYLSQLKTKKYSLFNHIYKRGLSYKSLVQVFSKIDSDNDIKKIISGLDLDNDSKEYFIGLTEKLNDEFNKNQTTQKIKINKKYFKQLERYLRKNEYI